MYYVIGAAAVILVALFLTLTPDFVRYMKIRSM
jgi:hypothetical protein